MHQPLGPASRKRFSLRRGARRGGPPQVDGLSFAASGTRPGPDEFAGVAQLPALADAPPAESAAADGAPGAEQRELSALAHSALTARAKRSPDDFRTATAGFSAETRTRMEEKKNA